MEIWYVRHGQTDWNVEGRIQGSTDIPLNQTGIEQAYQTKQLLDQETFDLVLASPLSRAYETAKIICEEKNIPIKCDERLMERNFGSYEGTLVKEMPVEDFWNLEQDLHPENGESTRMIFHRIYTFLDDLKQTYPDRKILLVAHGGIAIPFRCYLEGIPETKALRTLIIRNCEAVHYQVDPNQIIKNPFS